jgi:hypothetical protein
MERLAMVSQVDSKNLKMICKLTRVRLPVLAGTKQAMQDNQRLAAA